MCAKPSARLATIYKHLRQEFEVDGADLEDLVVSLKLNLQELRGTMDTCLEAGRWQDLARAGHSLKGVAANIGQEELRQIGYAIETTAPAGDRAKVEELKARAQAILAEIMSSDAGESG